MVKVIWQNSHIAVAHGRFNRIRQVELMCTSLFPWTHPSVHPKRHLDRFSHFCTAYGTESLYFVMGHLLKLPIRMGDLDSHLIHGSTGPPPKWHLDRFSLFCRAHNHDRQYIHVIHSTAMQPKKENKQGNQNCLGAHCSYAQIRYTNTVRKNLSKIASATTSEAVPGYIKFNILHCSFVITM